MMKVLILSTLLDDQYFEFPDKGVVTRKCIDQLKFLVSIIRSSYLSTVKPRRTTEIQNKSKSSSWNLLLVVLP